MADLPTPELIENRRRSIALIENRRRSIAMLATGSPALNRDEALDSSTSSKPRYSS